MVSANADGPPLAGQIAVVTGSARGIGLAVARRLADAEVAIGLLDLDGPSAAQAAEELVASGARVVPQACDVGRWGSVEAALGTVQRALGRPTLLVNNAGIGGPFHRIDEVDDAEWDRIMATNLKSVFLLCRALLPGMREAGHGRIVNIASIQGFLGAARSSTYVASKHGMIGYTRALAAEWGPDGVTCNAVCPGYVDTRLGVRAAAGADHEARILARTPLGRLVQADEVARLVVYLLGPGGGSINGAVLPIDGGISADLGI